MSASCKCFEYKDYVRLKIKTTDYQNQLTTFCNYSTSSSDFSKLSTWTAASLADTNWRLFVTTLLPHPISPSSLLRPRLAYLARAQLPIWVPRFGQSGKPQSGKPQSGHPQGPRLAPWRSLAYPLLLATKQALFGLTKL